jgi:hypothetical protein
MVHPPRGEPDVKQDEQKTAEGQQIEEPDEAEDLDVAQQQAEDVKGGTYAIGKIEPRFPGSG